MSLVWEQGREAIERMLRAGELEQVPASREQADLRVGQARNHLASGRLIAETDPEGGYAMVYDAARKALAAILANEGLRATSVRGHHRAVYEAVQAQLDPPLGAQLRPFNRMRSRRGNAEYPTRDAPALSATDVIEDAMKADVIIGVCAKVLDHMPVFVPRGSS